MKPSFRIAAMILAIASLTAVAQAQTIEKKSLTIEGAKRVIAAAVAYAKKNNAPGGVIAVVDEGGNLMALERLDGTFAAGANISIGKARTAVLFKRPTKVIRRHYQERPYRDGRFARCLLYAVARRSADHDRRTNRRRSRSQRRIKRAAG